MIYRVLLLLFVTSFITLAPAQPAEAHGYLVRAIPENRAVLERPPTRLQYWFSEALEPEFSIVNLRDQRGEILASGGLNENDNRLLTLRVPDGLPDGAYIVELRPAFASDGHVVAESRVFFVGEEIGGVAGAGVTTSAIPLEVAWRSVAVTSAMILFGTSILYVLVLVPAWGSAKHPAGLLPPRVMRRLNVIFGYALVGAFAANMVGLIQQTMAFFNVDFARALGPEFWGLVRVGSRFGDIWNWRMMFLGVVGGLFLLSLFQRESQPGAVRAYWVANTWMLALVIGSHSVLSHAAGSLLWPWVAVTFDWFHALAVGFWAGGLVALALVLPVALSPYSGDARRQALLAALRRFSPIAFGAVLVVVTTGIYGATNWIFSAADVRTEFGGTLAFKIVLAAALLSFGAWHHIALNPARFARLERLVAGARRLLPTVRIEAVFAVLVLFSASALSATPIPQPDFIVGDVATPNQTRQIGDLTVEMSVVPGGPGVNTHDTRITRDGQNVNGVELVLVNARPDTAFRSPAHILETVEDGLYVTATDDISAAGRWWSVVDLTTPEGEAHRLAFEWDIDSAASVVQSIDPRPQHVLALGLVLAALMWVAYPFVRRGLLALNFDIASVTVAFVAVVVTALVMVGGYIIIQQTRDDYAQSIRPPAQVVNAVLPTQASLERGAALYADYCIEWQRQSRDFNALRARLDTIRDDDLYFVVAEGWRGLAACGAVMEEDQRWDVVNYLRTLAR